MGTPAPLVDGQRGGSLCVVGSFMYDMIVSAPRRPVPGETLIGTGFETYLGGKGFNQAVAASRAGARTHMVGRLGDDVFGAEFRAGLEREGIGSTHVGRDPRLGSGVGLPVVEPGGENSIIVVPRANLALTAAHVDEAASVIAASAVLLLQLEVPIEASLRAAQLAKDAGTLVVLNPAPYADLPHEFRESVDIVVPNEVEVRSLAGSQPNGSSLAEVAEAAAQRWEATLVVTRGREGVLVLDRSSGERITIPAHHVSVVDTVGAGDVFCGYLGACLARGNSIVDAVREANAAAAVAVTRQGAGLSAPYVGEIDGLLTAPAGPDAVGWDAS